MASALACYTVSLRVSAERAEVQGIRVQIASDLRDIRALEAELRTRSRLPQLQRWNDEVLAMVPPSAKQFADTPTMLVAYAPKQPAQPATPQEAVVQYAVATEPAQPVESPLRAVAYTTGARPAAAPALQLAAAKPITATAASVQLAALDTASVKAAPAKAAEKSAEKPKASKPAAKALPATVTAALDVAEEAAPKVTAKADKPAEKKADKKPLPAAKLAEVKAPAMSVARKPAAEPVRLASIGGLSESLVGEIESAAAAERRGFRKVAMQ